jgi:hypothetical protein
MNFKGQRVLGLQLCRETQTVGLQLKNDMKSAKIEPTIRNEKQSSQIYGKPLKFGNI